MAYYKDHVYPQLVSMLGNPKPIQEIRQRIVPLAQGTVLEIGVGPGVNFAHYDPAKVDKVYALEPNPGMLRRAEEQRRRTQRDIEFLHLPGERIPLADASVDTVVSTFTLCTIPGVVEAIQGIGRVLKPHGKLIFFEHGLSPDPPVRRWQERSEPFLLLICGSVSCQTLKILTYKPRLSRWYWTERRLRQSPSKSFGIKITISNTSHPETELIRELISQKNARSEQHGLPN